jgi:oxygen-independent coproporphyrinogen-3 oxidase
MNFPSLKDVDLNAIIAAVGPAQSVQYNKPHVYPMATPMFVNKPGIERNQPREGPVEVYVHVPFCSYKCSFCTYATRQGSRPKQMDTYVKALEKEMQWIEPGTRLKELYIGGGTPTALTPQLLETVLTAIWKRVQSPNETVHTVECSPESITADHVKVFKQQKIERISMGIQSLDDEVLHRLHRHHTGQVALGACDLLVSNGRMLNVDLIYGLPGQTEESFVQDFQTVAAHGVHSVTVYNLRVNEKTPVAGNLEEDEQLGLERLITWRALIRACADDVGFKQTRWHTFVRKEPEKNANHPARRFENFPAIGNQIGIGMSARSRIESAVYRNHPEIKFYLQRIDQGRSPVEEVFVLKEADRKALFVGQYLGNGRPLNRGLYENNFGSSFEQDFGPILPRLLDSALVEENGSCISLTETGKLVFDLVNWMFYPKNRRDWIAARQKFEFKKRSRRSKQIEL